MSLVSVVYFQVKVPASGLSLVERSPTDCGVSEWDREASTKRRPWHTGGCCTMGNKIKRSSEWQDNQWMKNWTGCRRKRDTRLSSNVPSGHLSGCTEKTARSLRQLLSSSPPTHKVKTRALWANTSYVIVSWLSVTHNVITNVVCWVSKRAVQTRATLQCSLWSPCFVYKHVKGFRQ